MVRDHLKAFLEHLRLNENASLHTVRAYESDLSQYLTFLAAHVGRRVSELTPAHLDHLGVRAFLGDRNTYVNSPTVLHETWQTRMRPDLFFAGQMSGVEGYVESAASGLIAGRNAAALALGEAPSAPPRTTAIGALAYYAANADPKHYVPSNIAFGLIPPLEQRVKSKKDRNLAISERALKDLDDWSETTSRRFSSISG